MKLVLEIDTTNEEDIKKAEEIISNLSLTNDSVDDYDTNLEEFEDDEEPSLDLDE